MNDFMNDLITSAKTKAFHFKMAPYELIPVAPKNNVQPSSYSIPRKGVLLKIVFSDALVGYADCFPWVELGDASLKEQVSRLRYGNLTPLLECSLLCARADAEARSEKRSLFKNPIPKSHYLLTHFFDLDEEAWIRIKNSGFTCVKLKMGLDLEKELKFLLNFLGLIKDLSIQLRLDFNERLNPIEADSFFKKLMPLQSQIEFIEDPTPYHPGIWKRLQEHGGIPLALDRNWNFFLKNPEKKAVSILVLKPAIQDPKGVIKIADKLKIPIVVTSYLDHPVGQMYAAWVASEIKKNSEVSLLQCGIFSHLNYKKNHFSSEVRSMSNALQPPLGLGLGFDSLLNQISWLS